MKSQKLKVESQKNGYALISVLVVMMVLLIIVFYLADALFSETAIARNQKAASVAFYLAESGVQEAVWKVQNDPSTRNTFLNTINGVTNITHNPALLSGGRYDVVITNTARGAAVITSTGLYSFGLKTAQRKITVDIAKATTPPPYNYDGAIFTGGSTGEEDITFSGITLNVTGSWLVDDDNDPLTPPVSQPAGSLLSSRDIWFTNSTANIIKDIKANREIRNVNSTLNAGGIIQQNSADTFNMPTVDITSADPNSYKSLAIAQNQYYTVSQFNDLLDDSNPLTLTGIVYIAGNSGITIEDDQSLIVNGMLVSEGSVDVGKPNDKGSLTINHVDGSPSGIITLGKLTAASYSSVNINGLVYIGDRFSFDPRHDPSVDAINITGGVLCRRFQGSGPRTININFNQDYINEALRPNPNDTPVIQFQHWEEEY